MLQELIDKSPKEEWKFEYKLFISGVSNEKINKNVHINSKLILSIYTSTSTNWKVLNNSDGINFSITFGFPTIEN